jgi:hypothetical protein
MSRARIGYEVTLPLPYLGASLVLAHHLFPQVPTCHLPILARRVDAYCRPGELRRVF